MDESIYARKIAQRLGAALVLLAAGLGASHDILLKIYYGRTGDFLGLTLNGLIVSLFVLGIYKIFSVLNRIAFEERSIMRFKKDIYQYSEDPFRQVPSESLIVKREKELRLMSKEHQQIQHSSLAAIQLALLQRLASFPRFVYNTLILCGMFGTIISLSIALTGASNLMEGVTNAEALGGIIKGMSSALSTTMTAMASFLFFSYFYSKLTDCISHLSQMIEAVTATYLIPMLKHANEKIDTSASVNIDANLAIKMNEAAKTMYLLQKQLIDQLASFSEAVKLNSGSNGQLNKELQRINQTLEQGFRLNGVSHE